MSAVQLAREKLGIRSTAEKELIVNKLFERPLKEKGAQMPSYKRNYTDAGQVYQSDLLHLPKDEEYEYALVVVDTITGIMDAVPLKGKTAKEVADGYVKMFHPSRPLKQKPFILQVDPGSEFMGEARAYCETQNIMMRAGKVGRHRHQAQVEKRNWFLGKMLFEKQISKELLQNEENREWVNDLPVVIEAFNEVAKAEYEERKGKMEKKLEKQQPLPNLQSEKPIFEIGTKVRVKLDNPEDVRGGKLPGTFRAGDIRWKNKIYTITNIILTPNQPVMYQVDNETTGYTKEQLQIVSDKEEKIEPKQRGEKLEPEKEKYKEPETEKRAPAKLQQAENVLTVVSREVLPLLPPTRSGRIRRATAKYN